MARTVKLSAAHVGSRAQRKEENIALTGYRVTRGGNIWMRE
jgi:hypothetical protein